MKIRKFYRRKKGYLNLISHRSMTPGQRHYIKVQKNILSRKSVLVKSLLCSTKRAFGRSSLTGRITVRHRSGGSGARYRKLFHTNQSRLGVNLFVTYDPNRCGRVAFCYDFLRNKFFFVLASLGSYSGTLSVCHPFSSAQSKLCVGVRTQMFALTYGTIFFGLSDKNKEKYTYATAAGSFCQLLHKSWGVCNVRLPSGKIKQFFALCFGTLGRVSNDQQRFVRLGKAGRSRALGTRPTVRGIAMNPVDHPHGGRTNGGFHPKTPWGKPTRGFKTSFK